jgi:hypothetical protein
MRLTTGWDWSSIVLTQVGGDTSWDETAGMAG